eukprot:SM000009S23563  [mRNA]  locus=s9:776272:781348:- [translate_table: standard]
MERKGMNEKTPLLNGASSREAKRQDGDDPDLEAPSEDKKAGFGRILQLSKPERGMLFFATLALIVSAVANIALPQFAGKVIDAVTDFKDTDEGRAEAQKKVYATLWEIVAAVIIGAIATMFRAYLFTAASEKVVARLRRNLFSQVTVQEIAFFDVTRTGELLNRLAEDTQVIKNAATVNLSEAMRSVATALLGLGYMFFTSWELTLMTMVVIPVVSLGARSYGRYLRELSQQTQAASAAANAVAEESIGSIRTVRAFAQEDAEAARYAEKVEVTLRLGLRQARAGSYMAGGVFGAAALSVVAVVVYGARMVINGRVSAGSLSTFILYSLTVGFSLASLSGLYTTAMKAVGASQRVFQLLDRVPALKAPGSKTPVGEGRGGEIRVENVWFAYPSRPNDMILKGVNLRLRPGTRLALVGPSGGGKSTVASLVQRFYDPKEGTIFLDNVPLPEISHKHLHQNISIVSQEPVLFNTSIVHNIAYGCEGTASRDAIEKAAKMANAHDFIMQFPHGYDTYVGERGVRLSGGQKQRIAIARALLMDPRVLLLDEATSALDAESEYLVQDAMDRLMAGRTVLVIAHRLSTVQGADVVAVVSEGTIAEQGTHDELLKLGGIYAGLVKRQLQGSHAHAGDGSDGPHGIAHALTSLLPTSIFSKSPQEFKH